MGTTFTKRVRTGRGQLTVLKVVASLSSTEVQYWLVAEAPASRELLANQI